MTCEDLLPRLEGVRRTGAGYMARCPAHEDGTASLSIATGDLGVLLHCFAGCETPAICAALGIKTRDLSFRPPDRATRPPRHAKATNKAAHSRLVRTYDYHDADGRLLYQACRYEPKGFKQRRPDPDYPEGSDRWIWKLDDTPRVLYRLPELRASGQTTVLIAEGEKDAEALAALGFAATTPVCGARKSATHPNWIDAYTQQLLDAGMREAIILPDNDAPGQAHAQAIAASVHASGLVVRVVNLPGLEPKGDVSDYLAAGHRRTDLDAQIAAAAPWTSAIQPATSVVTNGGKRAGKGPSQATILVALAREHGADFFHTPAGDPFVALPAVNGGRQTHALRSTAFRDWLVRAFYIENACAPNAQGVSDALTTLSGISRFDGDERPVFTRTGTLGETVYLDLGDASWRAAAISAEGWTLVDTPPVHFRRARGALSLPVPARGGRLDDLRHLLNVDHEDTWTLLLGWLVGTLNPTGPYPVLNLTGEQGTAKSTAARFLRGLIDPNTAPLRSEPREPRDLMIAATNGWIIVLDNMSVIQGWLSDCLCRLATGGGFSTRQLFTDGEEIIFEAQRPVLLTGIETIATRGDLIDRALFVNLPVIPDRRRRPERELLATYDAQRPALLGALLDAVSCALARRDQVQAQLQEQPRMADFAVWMAAAEPALNWPPNRFLTAYTSSRQAAAEMNLDGDPVAVALRQRMVDRGDWRGTSTELLAWLTEIAPHTSNKDWPSTGRGLRGRLARLAPELRRVGLEIVFAKREAHTGKRLISIVTTVTPSPDQQNQGLSGDGPENQTVTRPARTVTRDVEHLGDGDGPVVDSDGHLSSPSPSFINRNGRGDDGDGGDGRNPIPLAREASVPKVLKL